MKNTTRLKKPQVPKIGELLSFDDLHDRPKYAGQEMTSETSIPSFETIRDDAHSMVVAEAEARTNADADLQEQIDAIIASSDVRDIVGTYAELEAYDTSKLGDKDIIKVLADETHDDAESYYRWSTSAEEFSYIGSVGPYYTQTETDTLIGQKQDILTAGDNVSISAENVISATDTTYSAGDNISISGTTISVTGLPNVLQTTGSSTTDIMSQDATTKMIFDGGVWNKIKIGNATISNSNAVAIGVSAEGRSSGGIALGYYARTTNSSGAYGAIAIGTSSYADGLGALAIGGGNGTNDSTAAVGAGCVAIGGGAQNTVPGSVNIGTQRTYLGYGGNSNYRLLSGLYDPQSAHDAATKGYVDTLVGDIESALHTINNGGNA